MANVQAVALSMKAPLGPEYNVISSTPQWHIGEGATENVIVCNKTFDLDIDEFTAATISTVTCDTGAFFLYYVADIDQTTYDQKNAVLELYYSEKGSSDVTLLTSTNLAGTLSQGLHPNLYATREGSRVTFVVSDPPLKGTFFDSGGMWSSSIYPLAAWSSYESGNGWLTSDQTQIFFTGGDPDGGYTFWKTSMAGSDGVTWVDINGVTNPSAFFWFSQTPSNAFLTPSRLPTDSIYVSLDSGASDLGDEPGPGIYRGTLTDPMVFEQVSPSPVYNLYGNGEKQAVFTQSYDPASVTSFLGSAGIGSAPAGYMTNPVPEVMGGVDDMGAGYEYKDFILYSDGLAVPKLSRSHDGNASNDFFEVVVDGMTNAKFALQQNTRFVAIWVGDTFAPPELYAEFFTSFTKSYEVRGYKA